MGSYSTSEVTELAGVTRRQLDYWIRTGRIPSQPREVGTGRPRRWTEEEVALVQRMAAVLREARALGLFRTGPRPKEHAG